MRNTHDKNSRNKMYMFKRCRSFWSFLTKLFFLKRMTQKGFKIRNMHFYLNNNYFHPFLWIYYIKWAYLFFGLILMVWSTGSTQLENLYSWKAFIDTKINFQIFYNSFLWTVCELFKNPAEQQFTYELFIKIISSQNNIALVCFATLF